MANGKDKNNGGNLGFEAELFKTADKLRGNMEPSDYKHVALGLIFLKYISDAFEARHAALLAEDPQAAEDKDEYLADNVFWVPKDARWSHLKANAKRPEIGTLIDDTMRGIDSDIRWNNEGSFHKDELRDLRFDFILANPPFNISDWGGDRLREDPRWRFGVPPVGNANFAWLQHIYWHLAPFGTAGVVLANGSMSSNPHYQDIPGFCKSATLEEIRKHGHVLTPGRYVGAAAAEDDGEAFADKMQRLSAQWRAQQQEAARLDAAIEANLKELGYGA